MKLTLFRRQFLQVDDEVLPIEVSINWINRWTQIGLKSMASINFTPEEIKTSDLFSACLESKTKYKKSICISGNTLIYNGYPLTGCEIVDKRFTSHYFNRNQNNMLQYSYAAPKLKYITVYLEVNDEACC